MPFDVVVTLIMMVAIIVLLFRGVSSPGVIFCAVPILAALVMGYTPKEINGFISAGIGSVGGILFLMVISVLYFSLLHETGVFQALIKFVMHFLGNSVLGTLFMTAAVGCLTQLDGSGATTALCTIPAMRPIYEKQKIRREALLLIESLASGVLCLVPWAPGLCEASAYLNLDVNEVFHYLIPLVVFSIVLVFLFCIPVAIIEKRRGAGMSEEEFKALKAELDKPVEFARGKGVAMFNGGLTLAILALLLAGKLPTNASFALGFAILLLVTYPNAKDQSAYMKRQAPLALNMAFTMLGIAVLVGVNNGTGALAQFATYLTEANAQGSIMGHLPFILCLFSVLLSITIGGAKNSVVVPAVVAIVAAGGIDAMHVMGPVFACGIVSANLNLFNASPYLALGLADVELKDHLKYSLLPVQLFSLIMIAFMVVTGMLSI